MARALTVETHRLPLYAATHLADFSLVTWANATTFTNGQRGVRPCAALTDEPVGVTDHPRVSGEPVRTLVHPNIARGVAQATIKGGEAVGYATLGSVAQYNATGASLQTLLKAVSGASGSAVWRAGTAMEPANPGEVFSFYVNPQQLSGLS